MLLANFGVIAGIIFLGIEVRQNTNISRASAYQQLTQEISNTRSWLISDESLNEAYGFYLSGRSSELEDATMDRVGMVIRNFFGTYENAYYFYSLGIITETEWQRFKDAACSHIKRMEAEERIDERVVGELK